MKVSVDCGFAFSMILSPPIDTDKGDDWIGIRCLLSYIDLCNVIPMLFGVFQPISRTKANSVGLEAAIEPSLSFDIDYAVVPRCRYPWAIRSF